MRLRCIGNAWDVTVFTFLLCQRRAMLENAAKQGVIAPPTEMSVPDNHRLSEHDALLQKSLVMMHTTMGDKQFCVMLAQHGTKQRLKFLALM